MLKRRCSQNLTVLIATVFLGAKSSIAAPPVSPTGAVPSAVLAHLSETQTESFSDAINALASQGHVAIVAEGAPRVARLAEKDAPDLTAGFPLPQAVAEVAASFDYDAQNQKGVFVLTKRYTDPKELPCVTLGECDQAFDDIVTSLNQFNPRFDERSQDHSQHGAVTAFFRSLSAAQLQAAQAKTLRYGELTQQQQGIVQEIVLYGFVQIPARRVQETVEMLDYAPKSVLTGKDGNYTALMIQARASTDTSHLYFRPLYNSVRFTSSTEPPAPLLLPKPAAGSGLATPEPMTFGDLVARLAHTGPPPVVDPALQDKPVSAAGLSNASYPDVLHALTVLYGFRIGMSSAGGPKIERQVQPTDVSLQDFAATLWTLLPSSMRRALHQEDAFPAQTHSTIGGTPNPMTDSLMQIQTWASLMALASEADHQVLLSLQPQFHSAGLSARIPVRSLDKATQRALAVSLSVSALKDLYDGFTEQTNQYVLDCFKDMDATIVYTVPSETARIYGQPVPSLYFVGTDPLTQQQIGLGSIRFDSFGH